MKDIIHKELCYEITGICFKIQDCCGRFCRERQYADEFKKSLVEKNIHHKREFLLDKLENNNVRGNRVDFIVENVLLVDIKAKNFITKEDYAQMQRYLRAADLKLGLIINFRDSHLKPKRIINYEYDKSHGS